MGAFTSMMGYSTKDLGEHMVEMTDWWVWKDIEVHKANKKVWTMKDEKENAKGQGIQYDWDCNMNRTPLACPAGMV